MNAKLLLMHYINKLWYVTNSHPISTNDRHFIIEMISLRSLCYVTTGIILLVKLDDTCANSNSELQSSSNSCKIQNKEMKFVF